MVTYNDLYDALMKERYSEELQVLPKNFISEAVKYFGEKKKFSEKEGDLFSDLSMKSKKKLENAVSIFKEILLRRRKKILNLAFVASETGISKKDFENLLGFEKELFEELVKSLEKAEKNLNSSMSGEKEEQKYVLVRFLENVEEFLGVDGEAVGPFEKGEVANVDKEIADILINDSRVEIIEED
jgi:DNA replication initiation complex subunit (GINS family)